MCTISVVIPTHNRTDNLIEAIKSILAQEVLPDEVIIVDDASQPPVELGLLPEYQDKIALKIHRNSISKGANFSRNIGIQKATGQWVSFLDDDDLFLPEKIKNLKSVILNEEQNIDLIYHPAIICMVNEGIDYISKPKDFNNDKDIFKSLLIRNQIGGTSMVTVNRQKLIEVGMFDAILPALQDYELWLRLAKNKADFFYINQPLTKYQYVTTYKTISKNIDANLEARNYILDKYKDDFEMLNDDEKKANYEYSIRSHIRRYILNKNKYAAAKYSFMALLKFRRISYLAMIFGSFFGIKAMYRLKKMANQVPFDQK